MTVDFFKGKCEVSCFVVVRLYFAISCDAVTHPRLVLSPSPGLFAQGLLTVGAPLNGRLVRFTIIGGHQIVNKIKSLKYSIF